jgi:predicted metal-dependent hydrolase
MTLIVLAGPSSLDPATLNAEIVHVTEAQGYGARLADLRPALIVVDGREPGWKSWAVTPRASAATRRIPVVVLGEARAIRSAAVQVGASTVLAAQDLAGALPRLLRELARPADEEIRAALTEACAEPLPADAAEAIRLFNAGEYYAQHDLFELLWMNEERPIRDLYRAILQVGIAYYHVERGNGRGALKMLLKAQQWLMPLPDVCQGVDVADLRASAAAVRAEVERLGADDLSAFDRSLLRPVRQTQAPPDQNNSTA